jgi:hypothetical protein
LRIDVVAKTVSVTARPKAMGVSYELAGKQNLSSSEREVYPGVKRALTAYLRQGDDHIAIMLEVTADEFPERVKALLQSKVASVTKRTRNKRRDQVVEVIGRSRLIETLFQARFEVARPERDYGIDLIAYVDRHIGPKSFIAYPLQLKAASNEQF